MTALQVSLLAQDRLVEGLQLLRVLRLTGVAAALGDGPDGLALPAAFAALLFAIHPLRVESVAWVTERRDVLSGFFYLACVLFYLRFAEAGEHRVGGERGHVAEGP